ncbi:pentapeptide repeat-containing protein [Terracoccus luteus]|uniref:Pentapeptide repeat protein n=2 Tax=Terracoccus luteus TaxID=53356 RepID=A0A839Q288_9MICO|nr:pentapeptide repeat-containing protein [Terracoccus luteus]MBB2988445.1 hypothetical protein [Terracoccus luteus]MCP2174100.1 hypothetical protein [Terracoccus luteus]
MNYADLIDTTITDSVFLGASLMYVSFTGAHVRSSDFRNISAPDLHLIGTTIESSNFTNAKMGRVFIKDATLTNNTFDQVNIWGGIIVTWALTANGNTWVVATCTDNKPSNTHIHSDCLQDPDINPPLARPTVVGPGTGVGHWYTGPVTLNWNWYDEGVLSDTACPRSTPGVTTPGTVTATCADMAGHVGTGTYDVRFDLVPPSLSATISHAPNGLNGWWRTAPTVSYTCSDTGSGIARCPSPVTAPQGVRTLTATAADVAGNTTSNYAPVKVDTVKPGVAVNLATLNRYGAQVPRCVATDATSGVATCRLTTTASASANYRYATATATDKAGNAATSAKVLYRATTVAAFTTAPSSVPRGGRFSVVVTSKNAKGALINLTGVRALLPVKTTSTGSGPANTTLSTYATRIGTGT